MHRRVEREQARDRLARHRSGHDVTADDERVHVRPADLVEHRFQGRKVPVNVVDRRDAFNHGVAGAGTDAIQAKAHAAAQSSGSRHVMPPSVLHQRKVLARYRTLSF